MLTAPILFVTMKAIASHYRTIGERLRAGASGVSVPSRIHALVLVSNLLSPTLRALAYAQATHPATLRAVTVSSDDAEDPLPREWRARGIDLPLVVLDSPYRETVRPLLRYIRHLRRENPGDVIAVIIPEYVVEHWWQNLLHNQTALRLKSRLIFEPAVTVTSVPWVLRASDHANRGVLTVPGLPVREPEPAVEEQEPALR